MSASVLLATKEQLSPVRLKIIREALSWLNTPYHDHAGCKGFGVDCAYFPLRVYSAAGLIPTDFEPPKYSPQQWLNSKVQKDKLHLKFEDRTFLDIVLKFAKREIDVSEIKPGDFVIYKVAASWTHGGIIINWPDFILHPLKERGVIGSHGLNEGFLKNRPHRFFDPVGD